MWILRDERSTAKTCTGHVGVTYRLQWPTTLSKTNKSVRETVVNEAN